MFVGITDRVTRDDLMVAVDAIASLLTMTAILMLILSLVYAAKWIRRHPHRKTIRQIALDLLRTAFWATIVTTPFIPGYFSNLKLYEGIRWLDILLNVLVLAGVYCVAFSLMKLHRIFRWSPSMLFRRFFTEPRAGNTAERVYAREAYVAEEDLDWSDHSPSLVEMALVDKAMKIPFMLVMLTALPTLVGVEERIFRQGTTGWIEGIVRSVLFGMAHLLFGFVPLGAAIALSILGIWLTEVYMTYGLAFATTQHLTYDALIFVPTGVLIVLGPVLDQVWFRLRPSPEAYELPA